MSDDDDRGIVDDFESESELGRNPASVLIERAAPGARLQTGILALDERTRGGIPPGKVVTATGAPGSFKTIFMITLAMRWAQKDGALVVGIFADEGDEPAATMLGQQLGFDRAALEDGDPETIKRFSKAVSALHLVLPDPDLPDTTLEGVRQGLFATNTDATPVVVIDSTDTVRLDDDDNSNDEGRTRVTRLMETARRVARELQAVVLVIAQSNRSSYRSRRRDNTHPLAAGAESRAIEYCSDLLLHLSADGQDEDGREFVNVTIAKNRLGPKGTFRLVFNRARAQLSELDEKETGTQSIDSATDTEHRAVEKTVARILEVLTEHIESDGRPGIEAGALATLVGGNRSTYFKARELALKRQLVVGVPEGKTVRWILRR